MAARTPKCTKKVREDLSGVDFDFVDGTSLGIALSDLPEEIVKNLALHGLSQKVGDSYAGTETVEDAISQANGVAARLKAGDWKAAREGGGGRPKITLIVEALHRATGKELEECRELVASMEDDAVKELKKHPQVHAHITAINAERAAERAAKAAEDAGDSTLEL